MIKNIQLIFNKLKSFKVQYIIMIMLVVLEMYIKIFNIDIRSLKKIINEIVPVKIIYLLKENVLSIINLALFIGLIGVLLATIMIIVISLNEKKQWFCTFLNNYNHLFASNKNGILDNLINYLVALPTNIAIIMMLSGSIFNKVKISEYFNISDYTDIFLFIPLIAVITIYGSIIISIFFIKIDSAPERFTKYY